jgi:Na+-transporting NADH:ubiquinone oxidoreductase subunit D
LGNGLGYAKILVIVAFFRELLGSGALFNIRIIPQSFYDLGYINNGLMLMPPMALIICAASFGINGVRTKLCRKSNLNSWKYE